jgi:chromosome segregation ATPase
MAGQAQVTSIEAIEAFRAALILFVSQARPALEEASAEVVRCRLWVQNDRRRFWEGEWRQRSKKLEQAQQEWLTARLSGDSATVSLRQMAVQRARQAVEEAAEKLQRLKRWDRELDNRAAPLLKEIEQLQSYLATETPLALAHLTRIIQTLEAYTGAPASGGSGAAPASSPEKTS